MVLNKGGMGALLMGLDFIERDYLAARGLGVRSRARLHARGRTPAGSTATSAGLNHRGRGKGLLMNFKDL